MSTKRFLLTILKSISPGRRRGLLLLLLAALLVACGGDPDPEPTVTPSPAEPTPVPPTRTVAPTLTPTDSPPPLVPLTDLGPGTYLGFEGGLYPGGLNEMPAEHDRAGRERAAAVTPRDAQGNPSANGKVVFLAIGIANAAETFCGSGLGQCQPWTFGGQALETAEVNRDHLALVNGAIYGRSAADWDAADDANYDFIRDDALSPQSLSENQVQVIWLKVANPVETDEATLPDVGADAYNLLSSLGEIVRALGERYPNLQQIFLSSRSYGGYAAEPAGGEPYAYETGFAVKWLIEAQIRQAAGQRDPNDRRAGDLRLERGAPWLAWGPYLWADGGNPRSDGLTWLVDDYEADGLRPSQAGEGKAGRLLLDFFSQSPYAAPWFAGQETIVVQAPTPEPVTPTRPVRGQTPEATSAPEQEATIDPSGQAPTATPEQAGIPITPTSPPIVGGSEQKVPLIDMGTGTYFGFSGGLYPDAQNVMPLQHALAGLERTGRLQPLDVNGAPSPEGKIVLLGVGMSNVAREFCGNPSGCQPWSFVGQATADPAVMGDPLVLQNGARSGQDAVDWDQSNDSQYGFVRSQILAPRGLSEAQVQVVWMKQANGDSRQHTSLPDPNADAFILLQRMGNIARALKARYPNLQMVFVSSRVYAGYAVDEPLNPEPYAYESGFAVKWLIEAQIQQMATGEINQLTGDLNYNSVAPWLAWGPYMWADGANPRSDGLVWLRDDFGPDGTHPFTSGNTKVGTMLLNFFKTSPLSACWFLVEGECGIPPGAR